MYGEVGAYIAIALAGYLLGAFPTAYMVVKRFAGKNILDYGTANVGTMNTHRATNSKPLTMLVLAGDMLKGAAALFVGRYTALALGVDPQTGAAIGGVLGVAGHNYSVFLKFKGGKGIATSTPFLLYFAPLLVPVWVGAFFATMLTTRLMVLGQIMGTVVAAIVAHFISPEVTPFTDALAVLVFVRHAPRLKNVVQGTEPKLYYKARSTDGQ